MENLGPPTGWAGIRGLRGDLDPDGLTALCELAPEFEYGEWAAALAKVLDQRRLGRARIFHYRELARIAGLITHVRRGTYRQETPAATYCAAAVPDRRVVLGRHVIASPAVRVVLNELFGTQSPTTPVVTYQRGRSIVLLTKAGVRSLDELPARVIGGLLRILVRTSVADEVLVTIDLDRREISDQLIENATTGRLLNLVTRPSATRDDVRAVALAVGRPGPNFVVAAVPAMLREALSRSISLSSLREQLVQWWSEEPTSLHLVELSQAVSLFGVPRVYRRDIRETALESYLRVGPRLYSHVYLTEAALGNGRVEAQRR